VVKAGDEAEMVCYVLPILPDVLFGDRDIKRKKPFELGGPAEDVGCVSRLGRLHDHCPLCFEDVFRAEEVQSASRAGKMGVERGLIVGRPGDLRNVEAGGDSALIAQEPQFCPLQCLCFEQLPDLFNLRRILSKLAMLLLGFRQLLVKVVRNNCADSAGQGDLPFRSLKFSAIGSETDLNDEIRLDFDPRTKMVFPLVPFGAAWCVQQG